MVVVHHASLPSTMLGVGRMSSMTLRVKVSVVSARQEGCSPVMAIVYDNDDGAAKGRRNCIQFLLPFAVMTTKRCTQLGLRIFEVQ